tara:strand:+ start:1919 stop:2257 length:339 start_codon:yes stop_codon:yes gene_type:complete
MIKDRTILGARYAKLKTYTCKDWRKKFSQFDCEYLKAKLATILWWDHVDRLPPGQVYLNELRCNYSLLNEDKVTDDELMEALMKMGYKKFWAYKRSRTPLLHKNERKKRNET